MSKIHYLVFLKEFPSFKIMLWKSNITANECASDSFEKVSSPIVLRDKENRNEDNNSCVLVDARSSENYLQNDDVIEV